jgi:hypothetical protein
MKKEQDFRFYPVWEVASWLGLNSDEYIKAFEERCRFSEAPTEKKLEDGLEIIKAAIFRRRIDSTSFQLDMNSAVTGPFLLDRLQRDVQIVPVEIGGIVYPLHMALEDPTGDSAIIEFIDGNMVIHHGPEYTVMTNEPPYPVQLANLRRYKPFGGTIEGLPGGVEPEDRFVRASVFLKTLPEPKDQNEAIAYLYGVIRNVSVPFGAVYRPGPGAGAYPTWWTSASDLKDRLFHFNLTSNPNIVWVNLNKIDFAAGNPVRLLDPKQRELVGDVTEKFVPASTGK